MDKRILILIAIILLVHNAGCLDPNNRSEEIEYEEITFSDDATGYVEEGMMEPFQNILFSEEAIITEFNVTVTWEDEPDVTGRINYTNQPDQVQVYILDNGHYIASEFGENSHGQPGQINVSYTFLETHNNSRLEGERNIEIHIEVLFAGDQSPDPDPLGMPRVVSEDDGNDFLCVSTWKELHPKEK